MSTTLIIGASGTVGTHLQALLTEQGQRIRRATSRTPTSPDQVQLDLVRGSGIAEALQGVDRAFLMSPPGHTNQDQLLTPLIAAARERGLRRIVLMTAMGANVDDSLPLRRAELALEGSGLPWNVIRPNWFMQNFHTYWLHNLLAHRRIRLPVGDARCSFIDARDIAAVAASLLGREDMANKDFDLTGGQALSHGDVAAILSRETGLDIRFEDIEPQAMLDDLLQAGLPRPYSEFLVTILGYLKAGYAERTTDAITSITGRAPRSFVDYAREQRSAWLGNGAT